MKAFSLHAFLLLLGVWTTHATDKKNHKPMELIVPPTRTLQPIECRPSHDTQQLPLALWFRSAPYAYLEKAENQTDRTPPDGIVGQILSVIMSSCCREAIDIDFQKQANVTLSTENDIQREVLVGNADLGFPLTEPTRSSLKGSFVKVVPSPGAVFLVKSAYKSPSLLAAVSGAWLLLIFVIAAAGVAGIVMYLSVRSPSSK